MTVLNGLVRNATTWIIHGNSLTLEASGGYHVPGTPLGGELHRLTRDEATTILCAPFAKPEASTALSPHPAAPIITEPAPETKAALDDVARQFTVDNKGQKEFGF
jgi:hypothetical protein